MNTSIALPNTINCSEAENIWTSLFHCGWPGSIGIPTRAP